MNILFLTHYVGLYGANRSLLALLDGMRNVGTKSIVLVPSEGEFTEQLKLLGIEYHIVPFELSTHKLGPSDYWSIGGRRPYSCRWFFEVLRRYRRNLRLLPQLTKKLRTLEIDLIHSNSSWLSLGSLLARRMCKPHVWHLREYGYEDYQGYPDWGRRVQRIKLERSGISVCISEDIQKHYFPNLSAHDRVRVVYNGVAPIEVMRQRLQRFLEQSAIAALKPSPVWFASVGFLNESKGHHLCLEAFAIATIEHPEWRLMFVGDGPEEANLKQTAETLGINHLVEFSGRVSDMDAVYPKIDVLLVASVREAMGRTTAEAMSHGLCVIGRNSGATPELIADGLTGFIFDGTAASLAAKMQQVGRSRDLRRQLGIAGLRRAMEMFSNEKYVSAMSSIFEEVTRLRPTPR